MSRTTVAELLEMTPGTRIETMLLVRDASDRETKKGTPYVALTLGDESGAIECRAWNTSGAPDVGSVLEVGAKVSAWQDQTQLTVDRWVVVDIESCNLAELVPAAPMAGKEIVSLINNAIASHCPGALGDVVRAAIQLNKNSLATWPAAKENHHARLAGLAQHILSMMNIAVRLDDHYAEWYPYKIDLGLVLAAIVFHDLGKRIELSGVIGTEYTDEGSLIGHIAYGLLLLEDAHRTANVELDHRTLTHLRHLILSHHGRLEWGSPVEPATPEAVFLHQIDMIDSRMDKVLTAAAGAPEEGGWVEAGYRQKYFIAGGE